MNKKFSEVEVNQSIWQIHFIKNKFIETEIIVKEIKTVVDRSDYVSLSFNPLESSFEINAYIAKKVSTLIMFTEFGYVTEKGLIKDVKKQLINKQIQRYQEELQGSINKIKTLEEIAAAL